MDAIGTLNRIVGKGIGFISHVLGEAEKPSAAETGVGPAEMVRVTDSAGNEYLCPVGKLKNVDFVKEGEKKYCFGYSDVSGHPE